MSLHLLIPMSGQGTRYQIAGYQQPKPAIPIHGIPMIERLLKLFPTDWSSSFVLADNHQLTNLPHILQKLRPNGQLHWISPNRLGPSYACLAALDSIPPDQPILVSYCDYGMVWDARRFEDFTQSSQCDACLISYRGFHAHYLSDVKYAYSRMQGDRVVEVREKGSFTDQRENEFASCGAYYFRSAKLLKKAIEYQMKMGFSLNGEYYTSLTIQALLEMNPEADVRVFEIPGFFQWGTPQDLWDFEYWEGSYHNENRYGNDVSKLQVDQILMPMAGLGSRFQSMTQKRKPFIRLQGQAMFQRALDTLPRAKKEVIVTIDEVRQNVEELSSGKTTNQRDWIFLAETPHGQALSVQKGLPHLNLDQEVLVTACDHGLTFSSYQWDQLRTSSCDAAVFGIQGFPETRRRPSSYSYIHVVDSELKDSEELPRVSGIGVKTPFTSQPDKEYLLVGTFWFRNGKILQDGIQELQRRGSMVNNELYLDGIFNLLLEQGLDVRLFPLLSYRNWGDPNSLKESMYWKEVFSGQMLRPRQAFDGIEF